METTNATAPATNATAAHPIGQKEPRQRALHEFVERRHRALRESLERFAARALVPLESLLMTARSRLLPYYPRVVVARSDDQLEVVVEVPGVDAGELEVAVDGSALTVRGARNEHREKRSKDYHRMERYRTTFKRTVPISTPIEPERVAATLKNGILQVRLPTAKQGNGAPHRVQVPIRAA
jgi:HSP20 family molecular chaperone IbpA